MSYVDVAATAATEHLESTAVSLQQSKPDLASEYNKLKDYFTHKLWHQLTVSVLDIVEGSKLEGTEATYLALYDKVILACDAKLNQLSLCRIASAVASSLKDATAACAMLENLLEKRNRLGVPSALFLESKIVLLRLSDNPTEEQLTEIKTTLQKGDAVWNEIDGGACSALVPSAHYEATAAYRKRVGPPEAFYREALKYLHYTPVESMTREVQYTLATDLSLAALTGDGVFNFGEITTTPILTCLEGTEQAWLMQLMQCFSQGDVDAFETLTAQHQTAISAQPALTGRANLVKEKITLLSLVNMIFERSSGERTLAFDEIAQRTKVPLNQVELLIMRALSLKLIRGSMDQVDQTVLITWVMPRVLDKEQLTALSSRFGEWSAKVDETRHYMVEHAAA